MDSSKTTSHRDGLLILALDVTGAPHGWMSWQQALVHVVAGRVERHLGDAAFTFHGGLNRLTGRRSEVTLGSILALRGRNPRGWLPQAPPLANPLLFHRDRQVCCYCGRRKPLGLLTRDHLLPLSRGGDDTWKNVVTACKPCNQRKGARTPMESGMALLYVPYVPSLYEGLILANRRILSDQMEFLVSLLPERRAGISGPQSLP